MLRDKFGAYWTNLFEVIQFLVILSCRRRPSWILKNYVFDPSDVWDGVGGVNAKLYAKFGENRRTSFGVIHVFENFKMAAGAHLVFRISRFPVMYSLRVRSREVGNRQETRGQNHIEEAVINNFSPRISFLLQSLYSQQRHLAASVVNYAKT